MKKRIMSALLAAAMVFALLPTVAWAAADVPFKNNGGNGTAGAPYLIANLDQLEAFQKYINDGKGSGEYFKLTATIDMSSKYSVGSGTSWTPIGTDDNPFSGTFDGGGFEISGLYINTEDYYKGLFGYSTGTIKNLTVSGSVTGGTYTGGIVGENDGGSVENCCNKSAVNGVSSTSGIAGYNKGGSIENCYNTGAVTGTGNRIGGIAGNNSGSVKNCYNTGTVSGAGYVGGIVGENSGAVIVGSDSGSIENCYNTGTVSSKDTTYTGGIAGSSGGSVKKCYYLDTCGAKGRFGGTSKTADQFASGEVAYLLQNGQDAQVWGQKLSDGADEYPVLTSDKSKKVLKVTFLSDSAEHAVRYTNPNGTVTLPEEPAKTNYTFEKWSQSNDAAGAEFNEKTLVTEDITVYAVGRDHFGGDSADITLSGTYGYKAPLTVNLDEHMKYANKSVAATGKFTYEISNKGNTNASIESENTLSVPTGLDADDYTITVKATEKTPQYSLMSVEDFGTDDVTLTVKVSITKAAASVTVAPTAKDLTYDGTEQELVTAGETEDGTIRYSLDNADYSTNIPKGTEAKAYTVWYKVVGDSNHNDSTPQSVGVTIKKANSEVTVADSSATYGDTLTLKADVKKSNAAGISLMSAEQDKVDFKAGETSLGTATVEYSDSELKSVGTATLTVTVDKAKYNAIKAVNGKITAEYGGSVNLNESTKDNITVTLNKKTLTYTATATNRKYNGEKTVEVTLTPTNANGDTVTLTATGTIDDANVGDGKSVTITGVTVGGEDAEYYQAADAPIGAVTVNIEKADSTVTAPTAKTDLTYNGTAQELLETAGSATGGELQYKVDEGTYSTAAPTAITAGEHTVYYKVVGNDNYNGIAEASIKVTIAKATPIFPEVGDVDGGTYEPGKKLSDVTVPEVDGGTLAWSEGETALNAGANSVQAVFTPDNSENYDPTSVTDTVTVNVAKATITGVAVQDVTAQFDETQPEKRYTLAAPTGMIEGDAVKYAEGDYNEANDSEADWKETCPGYSGEGTDQTITVRIERENYNTLYLKATIKITNEPAISGVDVTANDGLVYNGGVQELVTVTGSLGTDTVTYYVNDDPTGSTEKAMGTNAGSYSVKVKVEREGHHHFEKTVEVTIAKADPTTVVTPKDLTYTGAAQELVSGSAEGGELQYCLDGSIYSADIPIGTEAKAYTVWYKVVGDENHNDTEPDKVEVTIAQAVATVTAPKANTPLIYTGTAQELIDAGSVTSDVPGCGAMRYSLSEGSGFSADIPMGEDAQAYTVYWTVDGADETNYAYSAATSGEVSVTIAKAAAQVTVPPAARDLTYTGEEQALVTAGESSFGALAYSLAEEGPFTGEIPTATEAGTYTVYYMVEGSDNWNASPVGSVRVEIKKAASSATVTGSTGLVYSGDPQPLVASGASDTGTVVYALGDSATAAPGDGYTETIPAGTNAGTYYVWWKVLGDVDHGDTASVCLTVPIAKAESSATPPEAETLTYTGAAQQLIAAGETAHGVMKYALGDTAQATADYSGAIPEGMGAGTYYVWYKVVGDENHNDTEPDKVEVTIAQAVATVTAPKANTPLIYTGTAQELIDAGSVTSDVPGCGAMRYSLSEGSGFSADIPMGEDAQAYTVYWTVDGADETNYAYSAATSGEVSVTIAKAAAQVTVPPAARDLTYTGEEQALVTAGESSFGALAYSLAEEGPFTGEIPTATEAGTYTVYYMVEGSDNWNASPVGSVPVEIHPADSSATVRRRTGLVYSGQPQALVTAGNVTGGQLVYALGEDAELVPASGYTGRTPTGTNAGTYYVWWKILGNVDHGDTAPACLTVTIAPFPLTLAPVAAETPYTGAAVSVPVAQTAGQTPAIDPANIIVSYEQNGAAAEPILPGIYDVLVAVTDPNFALAGAAKVGTLTITHVHVYGEEWAYDESNHWHVCQGVGPCDAPRSDLAAHQLTWVDTGDGTGRQVCTVCGYVVGEHTHASETWRVDEENGQHYKTCDACGAAFDRADHALTWVDADPALHWQACAVCGWAGEKTAHAWDGGVVTQAPTVEAEGSRLYTCAVCGATRSGPISKLDTFQISGAVTDQAGAPLTRAAVRLTRGQETVAETVTDDQGRYSFSSVPAGLYNVAATWEDVTKTILVELSDADADQRDIQMPSGKVSSVVEVLGEDTPDVVVGGVDAIAEAEAASPTETVTVTLTVARQEEPTDKDEIDQLITGQRDDVLYLDVSLLKQINTQPTQAITDTGVRVLEIIVPYDFTGKRSVTVYRKHGGDPAAALTALAARPDLAAAEDGAFFADQENGWIAIYASKFSTYAIGYQTASSGASSVARYVLTAAAGEGGTIDPAGAIRVRRGADQSYAIRPEAGYEVADVLVDGASVGAVTAYTFENVAAAHTIRAVFQKAGEGADGLPFTDVAPGDWFYDSLREVYQRGLMQGVDATTFAPMQGATRATVVTILYRLAGSPEAQTHPAYADCVPDAWYAQAVAWAEETGVAIGYGDGRFGPDDPITREQLAVMLWRYAAAQGRDVSVGENTNILSYQDFDQIADWAIPGLQWAAGSGVLRGTASGATLSPKAVATRAELAAALARYCEAATEETNEAE